MTGEVKTVGLNVEPARAALRSLRNDIDIVTKSMASLTVMLDETTGNRLGRALSRVDKQVKELNETLVSIGTSGKMTGLSVLEKQATRLGYRIQDISDRLNAITIRETEREVKKGMMVKKGSESGSNLQRANLDMLDTIRDLTNQMRKSIGVYRKLEGTSFTPFDTIREQKTRIRYVGELDAAILRLSDTNREQTELAREVREVRRRLKQMWRSAGTTVTFAEDIKFIQEAVNAINNLREVGSGQTRLGQQVNRTTRERIAAETVAGTDPRVLTGAALGRTVLRALVQLENTARKIPSVGGLPVASSPSLVTEFALAVRNLGSVISELEKFPQLRVEHQGRAYGQASGALGDLPHQTRLILSQLLQSLGGSAATLLNRPGMASPLALRNVIVEPFSRAIEAALERLGSKTKLTATDRKVQRRLLRYNRPYTPQEQAYLEATGNIIGPVVPGIQAGGGVIPSREMIVRGQAFTRPMLTKGFRESYTISSQRGIASSDDYLPGDITGVRMRAHELWSDPDYFNQQRSDERRKYEERAGKLDRLGPDYSKPKATRLTLHEYLTNWLNNAGPEATYALLLEQLPLEVTPQGIARALKDLTARSGVYKFRQHGVTLRALASSPRIAGKTPVVDLARLFAETTSQSPTGLIRREQYSPGGVVLPGTLYVGRGPQKRNITNTEPGEMGWLGNPLEISSKMTRAAAVAGYVEHIVPKLLTNPKFASVFWSKAATTEVVQCWCKTIEACHGDIVKGLIGMGKVAFEETAKSLPTLRQKLLSGVVNFGKDTRGSLDIDKIISGIQRLTTGVGRFLLNEVGALGLPQDIAALSQGHGVSNFTKEIEQLGLTTADLQRGVSPELLARGRLLAADPDVINAELSQLAYMQNAASAERIAGVESSQTRQTREALVLSGGTPVPVRIESAAPGTLDYADWKFEKLRRELASNWNRPGRLEEVAALRERVETGFRAIDQPYTPQQITEIRAAAEAALTAARAAGNPNVRSEATMAFIAQTGQDPERLGEVTNKLQARLQKLLDMEKVYAKQVQAQGLFGGDTRPAQERLDRVRRLIGANQLYQDQTVRAQLMWDLPAKQKLLGYTPTPADDPFAGPKPGSHTKIDPTVEAGKYQKAFTEGLGRLGTLYDQLVATTTRRSRAMLQRQVDATTGSLKHSFNYWEMYDKQQAVQAQQALDAFTRQQQARVPPLKPPRGSRATTAKAAFAGAAYGAWQAAAAQAQAAGQPIPPLPTMFGGGGGRPGGPGGPGGFGGFGGPPQGPGGFRGWLAGPNLIKESLFGNGEPQLWRGLLQYAGLHQLMSQLYKVQEAISGSVEKAAEFSIALAQIQTISEDAARQGMEPLSESIVEMSKKWAQPLPDTTQALYNVISDQMGVMRNLPLAFGSQDNLDRSLEFLDSSAEFSRAAVTPIQNASEAIASVANSYQMGAGAASQIGAMLFKTIDVGRVTGQQLSGTIGRVMPLAAELGAQPQEILAGIAHQTIMGIKPEESYTLLSNVMLKLLRPTQALKSELEDLGIESVQLGVQGKGLQGFLEEITARSGTAAESIGELFNQIRGTRGVLTLTGKDSENYKRILAQIESVTPEVLAEAAKRVQKVPGMTYREIKTQFDIFWTAELGPKTLAIFNAVAGLHPQTVGTVGTIAGAGLTGIIGVAALRQLAQMSYAGLEKTLAFRDLISGVGPGLGAYSIANAQRAMRPGVMTPAAGAAVLNPYLIAATVAAVGTYMAARNLTRPEYDETRYLRIEAERQPERERRQTLLKIDAAKETKQLEAILKQAADNYFETFKLLGIAYQQDRKAVYDWADATTATMSRALQSRVAIIQGIISQLQTMSEQAESVKLALTNEIADARNMASDAIFERSLRNLSPRGQGAAYFARAQQYMDAARRTDDEDRRRSMSQQAEQLALQGFDLTGNERALNDILNQRVNILKQLYDQQEKIKQQAKRAAEEYEKGLFTFEKAYSRWQDLRTKLLTEESQKDSEAFKRTTVDMYEQAKIMQDTLDNLAKIDVPDKMGATLDRLKLRQLKGALEESFVDPVTGGMVKLETAMASMIERLASKLREVFDSLAPELVESINKVAGGDALNPYGGFGGAARKLADQGQALRTLAGQRADYRMNQELVRTLQEQLGTMRENLIGSWLQESFFKESATGMTQGFSNITEELYFKLYPERAGMKPTKDTYGQLLVPRIDLYTKALNDPKIAEMLTKQNVIGENIIPLQQLKHAQDWLKVLDSFEKRLTAAIVKGDKAGPGTTKDSLEKILAEFRSTFSREAAGWFGGTFTTQGRVNTEINKQLEQFSQQIAKTLLENLNLGVQAEAQENLKPAVDIFFNESARIRKAIEDTLPPTTVKTVTESSLEVQQALENIIAPLRALREEAEKFKAPVPTPPAPAPVPVPAPAVKPTMQQLVPQKQPVQEPQLKTLQDYYKLLSPTPAGGLQDTPLFREASYSPEKEQLPGVPEPESFMVTLSDPAIQASAASIGDMVETIKSAATTMPYSGGEVAPWYGGGSGGGGGRPYSFSLSSLPEDYTGGGYISHKYNAADETSYDASTSLYSLQQASDGAATSLTNMPETASYAMQAFQTAGSAAYTLTGAFESAAAQLASIRATPQGYASGGDVVPAMLTAGEFVTNPRASQTWYPVLRAMNNTSLPRYAEGGNVTNVGDVIVNINGSAGNKIDGREIAKSVRRALRQKTARLS